MLTHVFGYGFSAAISRLMLLSFVAFLPFIGGCGEDDNPIVDDEQDHEQETDAALHADADGFALEVDGAEVYRQFQGTDSGGLTVGVGAEIDVHVVFLDATGAEFHVGEEEEEEDEHGHDEEEAFSLGLSDYDSSIIEIHLEEEEDEHAEDEQGDEEHAEEELGFGLVGLKAGTTKIKLQLLHGGHPDFTGALLIPVTVQ